MEGKEKNFHLIKRKGRRKGHAICDGLWKRKPEESGMANGRREDRDRA